MDLLADFLDCSPEPVFAVDKHGAIVHLSASLARLVGPEAKTGTRLADRVHPDDRQAFDAAWARVNDGARSDGASAPFSFRVQGADGAYVLVSCTARRSSATGVIHGSLRDGAAEQKVADLERQARILHVIENSIPIAVWAIEPNGTFVHHAGKGVEAIGVKQGAFLGMNIFELYKGSNGVAMINEALKGHIGHDIAKQHDQHWESWYMPLRDQRGEITHVVGVTTDISAVTRFEHELREKMDLIERQQQVIRALSTPIIEVWDGVLTLPMMGLVDSARAAEVTDSLLQRITVKRSEFAILDLTGVDTIDTGTAAHLLKMIQAVRLLGAEGIIVGIQPSIATTMVTLGIDLTNITTRANLQDGLQYCIRRMREAA